MAWAPDYITPADLGAYRRIGDTKEDVEMAEAISSACRAIDEATDRQFGKADGIETRTYEAGWSDTYGLYCVEIDDVMDLTGFVVTVSGAAVTAGNYRLWPRNADKLGRPWERLYLRTVTPDPLGCGLGTVDVTANPFGWTAVPATIKNASKLQASRFFADRNMPHGIAGSPDLGNEMRLLAKVHPDVEVMVTPYKRAGAS